MNNTENREISINAEYLRLAQLFCSKEDIRYFLKGVHVEPCPEGGILIVATSGTAMAVFRDREGYVPSEMLIDVDANLIRSLKADKKDGLFTRRVTIRNDRLTIVLSDIEGDFGEEKYIKPGNFEIDGTFPEWRRVLPDVAEPCHFAVDLTILKTFEAVAKSLTDRGTIQLYIAGNEQSPIAIMVDHEDFYGVVMPCKVDRVNGAKPSWCCNEIDVTV